MACICFDVVRIYNIRRRVFVGVWYAIVLLVCPVSSLYQFDVLCYRGLAVTANSAHRSCWMSVVSVAAMEAHVEPSLPVSPTSRKRESTFGLSQTSHSVPFRVEQVRHFLTHRFLSLIIN